MVISFVGSLGAWLIKRILLLGCRLNLIEHLIYCGIYFVWLMLTLRFFGSFSGNDVIRFLINCHLMDKH